MTLQVAEPAVAPEAPAPPGRREVRRWHLAAGGVALAACAVASLFIGVSDLTPGDLLRADEHQVRVLLVSRIPRLAAILLAGTAMSVAGLLMQHLARNRFVAPSTAGTVESASLGLLVATLWFGSSSIAAKMAIAVGFALVGTAVFLRLLRRLRLADVMLVPLVGLMFGGVIRSVTSFFAYRFDLLQTLDAWTNGDFSGVLRGRYEWLYVAALVTLAGYLYADRFTVAGMGRDVAVNLGVRYERVVNVGLGIVSVITGVVVVTVGAIPFLGLIVPNLVTMARGDDLRRVLPLTALAGAGFVLACDVVSRTIRHPYEIPVGTVVGVVGSVAFVVLILRGRRVPAELAVEVEAVADPMRAGARRDRRVLVVAGIALVVVLTLYLTLGVQGSWEYALRLRARKVAAMGLVGAAIGCATVLFQTVTSNRILTPSIMGFDALYVLIQTAVVYLFGSLALAQLDVRLQFGAEVLAMVAFAGILHRTLFGRHRQDLYVLVLVGIVLGTLFSSLTSLVSRLIDPNEFITLQDRFFASFGAVDDQLLAVSAVAMLAALAHAWRSARRLDVVGLGRDHATNLGVDHRAVVNGALVDVAVLVSVATALAGPITFFGLLVANLARQVLGTARHRATIPAAGVLGVLALIGGQLLLERVFAFDTSLSIIVGFVGGTYFLLLLLREARP